MLVKQAYEYVNAALEQMHYGGDMLAQDYGNIVEIGTTVVDSIGSDNFTHKLTDVVFRTDFAAEASRSYSSAMPPITRDRAEFGAIKRKIRVKHPKATANESWELRDGAVYEQDQFYGTDVVETGFAGAVTFEIPLSVTRDQVKSAFSNAGELDAFLAYIKKTIKDTLTEETDELERTMYKNLAGDVVYESFNGAPDGSKSTLTGRDVLYLYNKQATAADKLTHDEAMNLNDRKFLKFVSKTIGLDVERLTGMSGLFNIRGELTFTPKENQKIVMLNDFVKAMEQEVYGSEYHNEWVKLPGAFTVPYWQMPGSAYEIEDTSRIYGKTKLGNNVDLDGILCVIHDDEALAIAQEDAFVDSHHNGKASFDNFWYKVKQGNWIDYAENAVVYFIGPDPETEVEGEENA